MLYKQYDAMERGDWEATARQFYTANASIARRHLDRRRRVRRVVPAGRGRRARLPARRPRAVVRVRPRRRRPPLRRAQLRLLAGHRPAYGRNDVIFGRDLGQRWLLESIGREFHGRHRLVRGPGPAVRTAARLLRRATIGAAAAWSARGASRPAPRTASPARPSSALYNLAYYRGMADELGSGARLLDAVRRATQPPALAPRVGFVLEQTLGHITHADNLVHLVGADPSVDAVFAPIDFDVDGWAARVPGSATGRSAPASGRRQGDPPAERERPDRRAVRPHPGAGDPHAGPRASGLRPSSPSTRRRSSTTSSATTTATTPAARVAEQLKWRANRALLRPGPSDRGLGALDASRGSSTATTCRRRRST